MCPREDLNTPSTAVHPLKRTVKTSALEIPGSITGQEDNYARVAIVIQRVLQHAQLQDAVWHVLLSSHRVSPIKQANLDTPVLHSMPELEQFRRNRARGQGLLQWAAGMGLPQEVVKLDANAASRAGPLIPFLGESLRLVEDVGVAR